MKSIDDIFNDGLKKSGAKLTQIKGTGDSYEIIGDTTPQEAAAIIGVMATAPGIVKAMNSHAGFSIAKETAEYIYIIDDNAGEKSVTNDAHYVLQVLKKVFSLGNRRVFYKDSEGRIDELLHVDGSFLDYRAGHNGVELE